MNPRRFWKSPGVVVQYRTLFTPLYACAMPVSNEDINFAMLFRAIFIASTDSSAFLISLCSAFFSLPFATSACSRNSTSPFSISAIFCTYFSRMLLEYSISCSSLRKISLTETISLADCKMVFFFPINPAAPAIPPTPAPTPMPRAAPPPTIAIVPPAIPAPPTAIAPPPR